MLKTDHLNLTVSKDVGMAMRLLARKRGISLSRLVERALVRFLDDLERPKDGKEQDKEQRHAA